MLYLVSHSVNLFELLSRIALSKTGRQELGPKLCEALGIINDSLTEDGVAAFLEATFPPPWRSMHVMETACPIAASIRSNYLRMATSDQL